MARGGSTLVAHLLAESGYWLGHYTGGAGCHEDAWVAEISTGSIGITCGLDHGLPERRPDFDAVDDWIRQNAGDFLRARARAFPWGFKYPHLLWGVRGWLDTCPNGKFIIIVRQLPDWQRSYERQAPGSREAFYRVLPWRYEVMERVENHPRVLILRLEQALFQPIDFIATMENFLGHKLAPEACACIAKGKRTGLTVQVKP